MAIASIDWLIYTFIFALGYVVGRVITTIQYGLKFDKDAKLAKNAKKDFVKKFAKKKK